MNKGLKIDPLADHPEAIPLLKQWFEGEWGSYYGATGDGNAEQDLIAYSNQSKLPTTKRCSKKANARQIHLETQTPRRYIPTGDGHVVHS